MFYISRQIDLSESLGLTASQKFILFLHFPIIFHELSEVEVIRPYWRGITSLVAITKIVLAKKITEADRIALRGLVVTHLEIITDVHHCHLKPKHHFLSHYEDVIKKMGLPTHMWTMR